MRRSKLQIDADNFYDKANNSLKQSTLHATFPKYEDAIYYYERASDKYCVAGQWETAARCEKQAAECELVLKRKQLAALQYLKAGELYRRVNIDLALQEEKRGVKLLTELGLFQLAAHHYESMAEIYLEEYEDLEEASNCYQFAGDFYLSLELFGEAELVLDKAARLYAELKQYAKASKLFFQLGRSCIRDNLRSFNAHQYFLNAGIVLCCNDDPDAAHEMRRRSRKKFFLFEAHAAHAFLRDITECLEDFDIDSFADHCYNFENVMKLDSWTLKMLGRIAELIRLHIQNEEDALEQMKNIGKKGDSDSDEYETDSDEEN
eukprot:g2348.t1